MGSSFSVMRGTNTYCGIVEISYLMHHQVPARNLAKNEYPQDPDAAMVEYTMGGEHGGGNNDNNMMIVEQEVNNNDNNMPQTPPTSGAGAGASSSPKSIPRP
jgi:5-methylcytosine-specific restriction endonuclease McrA